MKYYVDTKPRLRYYGFILKSTALHEAAISVLVTTTYGRWRGTTTFTNKACNTTGSSPPPVTPDWSTRHMYGQNVSQVESCDKNLSHVQNLKLTTVSFCSLMTER